MSGSSNKQKNKPPRNSSGHCSDNNTEQIVEPETLSASVNLEDIIEDYDGPNRSKSTSIASFLNTQLSQYFSAYATNSKDDETVSFYSALQDGFSLTEYRTPNLLSSNPTGTDSFWDGHESGARDPMLPRSNFEVSWCDLNYQIVPKITMSSLWSDLQQKITSNIAGLISKRRSDGYQFKRADQQLPIRILQQISGSFKSGELTGVLGPSGAGKTSLLNFLSRRREEGYTGVLNIDNSYRRIKISAIPQHDYLPEYLTVRENLMFASRLNNRRPRREHEANIERVAELLGIDQCLDVRTKKISGGQHKRLEIAQELLTKPDILILDEPTSGLDSLTCHKTISVLKNLVKSSQKKLIDPIAIVLTIHQPQHDVFDLFDKVYIMANGGIAIYDGPPHLCTDFIARHTGIEMTDEDYNPATFAIEIASGEFGIEPIKALEKQVKLEFKEGRTLLKRKSVAATDVLSMENTQSPQEKIFNNSFRRRLDKSNVRGSESLNGINKKSHLYIDERIARGSSMIKGRFFGKTRILSERYWISILRDPKQMIARILFHIFLPVVLAAMMGSEPGRSKACPRLRTQYNITELVTTEDTLMSSGVQEELLLTLENLSILFVLVYALTSANIAAITLSFTLDMQSSLKEHYNGWYSMPSYLIARIVTDIPMSIVLPTICIFLGFPLTGQLDELTLEDSYYRVLLTTGALILGTQVGQVLGMIVGAVYIGHVTTALFISQGVTLPMIFLSGFVVRTRMMSKMVYLLSYTSFYRHVLEVTVVARYGFDLCRCDPSKITGMKANLVGISDQVKSFTQTWVSSMTVQEETAKNATSENDTTVDNPDLFSMFAKQVSLYNTYGIDVKGCNDILPYQLHDLSVRENSIAPALAALVTILLLVLLTLFILVKFVVQLRTSL